MQNIIKCNLLLKEARYGTADSMKALIEAGADVNRTDKEGKTALMVAARYVSTLIA